MSGQNGALATASDRLRDGVPGFKRPLPRRPGRPRKIICTTGLTADVPQRRQPVPSRGRISDSIPLEADKSPAEPSLRKESLALPPRLLGPKGGGVYLGVSAWTVRQLVDKGYLRPVALPGIKRLLVDRVDLDALIEKAKGAS